MADFANVWQGADKIVYSTTLQKVSTTNTRLERRFDPKSVREMKATAASDLTVGGPTSRRTRSTPGWSMSASSSFIRCSSVKESPHSPAPPASSWSCWKSTGSATVS